MELRREVSTLEQSVQSAQSAASSAKFKEQSLQQEVESLSRTNEWLDNELKTKAAEHTKFRREKSSRIAELQQQNEDVVGSIESLQRSENALRTRITELSESVEERLTDLQALREDAANKEENFRRELDTANRLNALLNDSLETERRRNRDLSSQLDVAKENAAGEVGRLGAEIETEHQEREAAESRVAELEVEIERLRSDLALLNDRVNAPAPATPRFGRSVNGPGTFGSPAGSRLGSPAPSAMKGSLSYTQLVSDYHAARSELDAEKRRNQKLNSTIDDMMREMEDHQPAIEELQGEHARLEAHIVQMSTDMDRAARERDAAKEEAEMHEGQVSTLLKEGEILRQQLRDLSAQVRVLVLEVNVQKQGAEGFTQEERSRLEALARGQAAFENTDGASQTDRIISQQLTTFKNIEELQSQNERLMRAVRELSDVVESKEHREAGSRAADAQKEVTELRKKLEQSEEKMSSMVTMSNSYVQERDMFRRMVLNRSQIEPGSRAASVLGESTNSFQMPVTPARNGVLPTIEGSPSAEIANYSSLLKELQTHYDDYKTEAAKDRSMLKTENDDLSRKNTEMRTELSKKTGEASLAVDRYGMLEGNYALLKNENVELQKRSQKLSDQAAKQEIRSQQVTEDLVETKGLLESMRNETANLKAEKDFWKSKEKRLTDDNTALVSERDRLNALNANFQALLNDREHDDSDTRRRLQSQIETLEADLQATRRKLNDETEEGKRAAMRREYESQQNQSRIDDLVTRLGSVREELVEAKTSRDHLQTKADELAIELRSAEERVQLLQPRQTPSGQANADANATGAAEGSQNPEQALALEVSELKRDLDLSRSDLSNARTEIEQYQAISRDAEAQLASLNETQEQYRKEMDELLEQRNSSVSSLEKKIEELQAEISTLNGELGDKIRQEAEFDRKLEDQRAGLNAEISRLKSDNERTEAAAHFHHEDLKAQAQIAQQAQKNYEDELVKHAEAAKSLSAVRSECQSLKLQVVELRGTSEAAQTKLTQNEESWNEAKERYENELREIDSRKNDLFSQNRILHQQLETLSNQLGELKKRRTSSDEAGFAPAAGEENWQELVKYVRREKEIVEVQFELSSQESKRLRQQLDYTQTQLEETRLKLAQHRKAEENNERSALNHKKLMDTINELNLNRESNATLRLEKNELRQSLNDKESAVEGIQAQIQPLRAKLQELEDLGEIQSEELRMTREARERFEQRYLDVLHKSNTIDPAEFDGLKQKVTEMEAERDDLTTKRNELQEQVDGFAAEVQAKLDEANAKYQESRTKLIDQSKKRDREQSAKIRERDATLQTMNAEKSELEAQLKTAREEVDRAKSEKEQAQNALAELQAKGASKDVQMTGDEPAEQTTGAQAEELQALQEQLQAANSEAEAAESQVADLQGRLTSTEARVLELEQQHASQQHGRFEADTRVAELESRLEAALQDQSAKPSAQTEPGEVTMEEPETATALLETVSKLEAEAEDLKAKLLIFERAEKVQIDDRPVADIIAQEVDGIRTELTNRHEERVRQAEERFTKRLESMKNAANKKFASVRSEVKEGREAATSEALDGLRREHAAEIEALKSRHAEEIQKLQELAKEGATKKAEPTEPKAATSPTGASEAPDLTEAQIRELLTKNAYARRVVQNNIQNREKKVREEQQKLVAEAEATVEARAKFDLAQAKAKAESDQAQAVIMEAKKSQLKISMSENRFKAAQVKVDIVQKAAGETPEKPVGEVWTIAKDAKPMKTPAPTSAGPSQPTNPFASTKAATQSVASPASPAATAAQSPAQAAGMRPSTKFAPKTQDASQPPPSDSTAAAPPSATTGLGTSIHAATSAAPSDTTTPSGPAATTAATSNGPSRAASVSAPLRGGSSGLPVPAAARGRGQTPAGPRGWASNIGRGRGGRASAPGRGGGPAGGPATGAAAPTGPQASGGGGGATGASVPAKRAREDSGLESSVHGDAKRPRGGGQFSG